MKSNCFVFLSLLVTLSFVLTGCGAEKTDQISTPTFNINPDTSPTATIEPTAIPTSATNICTDATNTGARTKYSFEQILPCLNSIEKVSLFTANNMTVDPSYDPSQHGGNEYAPAWVIYERGIGDCDDHAILQCYFLEKNGLDAVMVGMDVDKPTGYNVCAVNTKSGTIILDSMGIAYGPFVSIEDSASSYKNPVSDLRTIPASAITQITTDLTTPSVLGLPWKILWDK